MRYRLWGLGLAALLVMTGTPVMAQSVQQFLDTADRIPRNASAMLYPSTRRLMAQIRTAFKLVTDEQVDREARGLPKTFCPPERLSMSPDMILNRFQSIPPARRNITVNQAVREWMTEEYPCN